MINYNKKILTSVEPDNNKPPIINRIYNQIKSTIIDIITPPLAGSSLESDNKEPLLSSKNIKKVDSMELIKDYF